MAEDLSTYTEVDPNSHISATSSRMTGGGINRNETAYAYYDKGADYFDALDIDFDIRTTNLDSNDILGVLGISNTLDHIGAFGTSDIKVAFYYPGGGARGLYLGTGGALDYMVISVDTTYYCTLERAAGSAAVSLKVYSDSGRETLLDTLTGTMAVASTKHRYILGIASQYTNNNYAASGYVENVVINAVGGQSVIPIMMAHRRRRIA